MKKYILSSILMINSALLMSQNIAQTNVLIIQTNQSNVSRGSWLTNESRSNTNKQTNRNNKVQQQTNVNRNIAPQQQFDNRNVINTNNNVSQSRGRGNQNPIQSVVRNVNPAQVQRQTTNVQRGNVAVVNEINSIDNNVGNIANEDNNPIFNNGNLQINTENVQNKQVQFLADNNDRNIQLLNPQINLEINIEQQAQTKTAKVKSAATSRAKEVKIKTFTQLELKPVNTRIRNSSSESGSNEINISSNHSAKIPKVKTEKAEKHKGGSSYRQNNKSYFGKKVKIWCRKNLKFAKKIRMSVSCPKF